ncbi:tyrosine-type recombinase/integrase [Sphaerisporangium sp. NPDC004334]
MSTELVPHLGGELVLDEELQARLQALDQAAAGYVRRNANTERGYASDWRAWERYVAEVGIPLYAATIGSYVGFVLWQQRDRKAWKTIDRRIAGVTVTMREAGVVVPQKALDGARLALDTYKRELAEAGEKPGRGQARAILMRDLRQMSAALPDTLAGVRDRAILTVGWGIAGRRAEIANLLGRDITEQSEGLLVEIRFGKTGGRTVAVPRGQNPLTCAVRAWQAWVEAVRLDMDGPAFRRIDRHGNVGEGLRPQSIGTRIERAALLAGLPRTTAHGLRSGLATEARRADHDAKTIAVQGGWSPTSAVMHEYLRIVEQWTDNAVKGTGM